MWSQRLSRIALAAALLAPSLLAVAVAPATATSPTASTPAPDLDIVRAGRWLTVAEIRGHATSSPAAIARVAFGNDAHRSPMQVYAFGDQIWSLPSARKLRARVGVNAAGQVVHEVIPEAAGPVFSARAGFAVPPSSAFAYYDDATWTTSAGTWRRNGWWSMTKANNYRTCSSGCDPYDYYRVYGRMQASAVQGSDEDEGFKHAWLEFDRKTSGANQFEVGQPRESIAGPSNFQRSVGFGANLDVNLGKEPLTAGGSINGSYSGTMTQATENWHPIVRPEESSGGVQWCRYERSEFTGTKYLTTRVSNRVGSTAGQPKWNYMTGQRDDLDRCPTRL